MKPTIEQTILVHQRVGKALSMLEARMADLGITEFLDELHDVRDDYDRMADSLSQGQRDPSGGKLYASLLKRTYRLYNNVRLSSIIRKYPVLTYCRKAAEKTVGEGDVASVKASLEGFVQDLAMQTLFSGDSQEAAIAGIYAKHQRYMDALFGHILVSWQWTSKMRTEYAELLASPTVDQSDGMLIVSGVTLSLMQVYDVNKWMLLYDVYMNNPSQQLRQRALVGMVLTVPDMRSEKLFGEVEDAITGMMEDADRRKELLEMQIQLCYSASARTDSNEIQRDILPALSKESRLDITKNGIVEKDDATIDDILNSEDRDRSIKEIEDKMSRIMDMQKKGSDVYFGGFSKMKRFGFFSQISNWFMPFTVNHPDLSGASMLGKYPGIKGMLMNGPFCDSDKYSFFLSLSAVVEKLPPNILEMLASNDGPVTAMPEMSNVDRGSAMYVRRMYLQDLYRFFELYPNRIFANPFEAKAGGAFRGFFFANTFFRGMKGDEPAQLSRFLFKRKRPDLVAYMLGECRDAAALSLDEQKLLAHSYLRLGDIEKARVIFSSILEKGGEDAAAIKGMADSLFLLRRYAEGAKQYARLTVMDGQNISHQLHLGLALVNGGDVKEGMATLYKLYYEHDSDLNVMRAMAWGYLADCKPKEADSLYEKLLALAGEDRILPTDLLNSGYVKWIVGDVKEAKERMGRYLAAFPAGEAPSLETEMANDRDILSRNGIEDYVVAIMLDGLDGQK
ncbi:hypothetical protein [Prevotella sp.]|uniref:hypothetical protein n=1 Tax=Prevotella sp. TaxID=59823 RepID=UPI0025F53F8D|nr:hypothetical protein [Prevotella sp.]